VHCLRNISPGILVATLLL